jgi:hypothetical protein
MKRFESKDPDFVAWVEVPDEWLNGHYTTYIRAYSGATIGNDDALVRDGQVAGALALVLKGVCRADIPGIDFSGETPDLSQVSARGVAFLLRTISHPLEATQVIPLALSVPSEIKPTEARKKSS